MFTGIIETCGNVEAFEPTELGGRLRISVPEFASEVVIGESVAVNGCCLTATKIEGPVLSFDLLHETLRLTNLGDLVSGSPVNLERSLRVGDRLSGHFVQGHVDLAMPLLGYDSQGDDHRLEIELPAGSRQLVAHKGSIAIDGISLTIAEVNPNSVVLWIIPHTHQVTNLKSRQKGDRVNLEFDMLAKYLARMQEVHKEDS